MHDVETLEEFKERWGKEFEEWSAIRDEMMAKAKGPVTAAEVSDEQRRRMKERGETSVLDGVFARRLINRKV